MRLYMGSIYAAGLEQRFEQMGNVALAGRTAHTITDIDNEIDRNRDRSHPYSLPVQRDESDEEPQQRNNPKCAIALRNCIVQFSWNLKTDIYIYLYM